MKVWIETKKNKGQRVVSCTLNPKNGQWNKPHAGTYDDMKVLYIDNSDGHIHNDGIHEYNALEKAESFLNEYEEVLTLAQRDKLTRWYASNIVQEIKGIRLMTDGRQKFYEALILQLKEFNRSDLIDPYMEIMASGKVTIISHE